MRSRKDRAASVKQAESVKPAEPVQPNESKEEGKKVTCSRAQEKQHCLFIGNIPKHWTEDVLREMVEAIGVGVTKVDLVMNTYRGCNKHFAFVEYRDHDRAKYSKEKMSDPTFKLDGNAPTVTYYNPSASQVNSIYVKNLPNNVTEDQLRRLFEHHGKINTVDLPTP
ncbi:heterogeneous nuclear ribonucleoprotein Q-like [Dioscorea cayenensis subsp. rotundata]|uniref:Heterogeneous nuclear ribonucleoprotein Q-like n=1 Tax=Dioscorea cayennensis subsp. rotundata TaxID=55577 RepID=A0AB40BDF8_DIOCR|nr:heterogeneous nuclear ribonucleoprotein Q-like [Dioscorea cayenensis subsp. rotundata]